MTTMSKEKLVELFLKKAAEPPPEANLILARHLQCKESCDLAQVVSEMCIRDSFSAHSLMLKGRVIDREMCIRDRDQCAF